MIDGEFYMIKAVMSDTELKLRRMLWIHHRCKGGSFAALYGDDGEMQCHNCFSDFLRMTPDELWDQMMNHSQKEVTT